MSVTAKEFEKYIKANRAKYMGLSAKQEKELGRLYIKFSEYAKLEAEKIINKEGLTYASRQKMIRHLLTRASDLTDDFKGLLDKAMIESANLQTEVSRIIADKYSKAMAAAGYKVDIGSALFSVPDEVVNMAYKRIWEDGLKLSDRIWQLNRRTRGELERIIMEQIATGKPVSSRTLEARINKLLNPSRRAIKTKLHGRNVLFDAQRILRTESAVAFREANRISASKIPGVKGIKWELSPSEGTCTTCIDYASSDKFGLGAGVFPPDELPVIPHPQCNCYTYPVTISSKQWVDNWSQWVDNKASHPEITEWVDQVYKKAA